MIHEYPSHPPLPFFHPQITCARPDDAYREQLVDFIMRILKNAKQEFSFDVLDFDRYGFCCKFIGGDEF